MSDSAGGQWSGQGGPGDHGAEPGKQRLGGVSPGMIVGGVVLVLLLIFILQNTKRVSINFLWMDSRLPVGIALLFSAVCGAAIIAIPGYFKLRKLRRGKS